MMELGKGFFSKTHSQREYEECIVSLLVRRNFPFDKLGINSFSPEQAARLGYLLELAMKIASRCGIKPLEFLSEMITIARQRVENTNVANVPLFEGWVPGSVNTLGRRWRLKNELVFKNIENEVKRWMICIKKPLNNS